MSKGTTGHGQHKCGTYRCKGGCEKGKSSQKSMIAEQYKNRQTSKYQDPVKNELVEIIGIDRDDKDGLISLYERIRSAYKLTTSLKYVSKNDLREAMKFMDDFNEREPGIFVRDISYNQTKDPGQESIINLNDMTFTDKHRPQLNESGKRVLLEISNRLFLSLRAKFGDDQVYEELNRIENTINQQATEDKLIRKQTKYNSLKDNEKIPLRAYIDRMEYLVSRSENKLNDFKSYNGYYGVKLDEGTSLIAEPYYDESGDKQYRFCVKYWDKKEYSTKEFGKWINFPMTKGNLEKLLKDHSPEAVLKIPKVTVRVSEY